MIFDIRRAQNSVKQLEKKHPLAIRWLHWINFPLMIVLTWSGLLLYVENNNFRLGLGPLTLFHFFPQGFYTVLHLRDRNNEGLAWHLLFMWPFAVAGVLYVVYTTVTDQWRYLIPGRKSWGQAFQVVFHDLGLRRDLPPRGKYNAAQKIAYTGVAVMGILMTLTGFALWKPDDLGWLALPFGGADGAKAVHFWLTILFVVYFVIHVAQVARAGWGNFRSMITGSEIVPVETALMEPILTELILTPRSSDAAPTGTAPLTTIEPPLPRTSPLPNAEAETEMHQMSRRSFLYTGGALLATLALWLWLASLSGSQGVPPFMHGVVENYKAGDKGEKDGNDKPRDADAVDPDKAPNQK